VRYLSALGFMAEQWAGPSLGGSRGNEPGLTAGGEVISGTSGPPRAPGVRVKLVTELPVIN